VTAGSIIVLNSAWPDRGLGFPISILNGDRQTQNVRVDDVDQQLPTLKTCSIVSLAATSEFVAYILSMFHPILPARLASPTQAFFITGAKIIVPIINGDLFAREDVRLSDNLDLPRLESVHTARKFPSCDWTSVKWHYPSQAANKRYLALVKSEGSSIFALEVTSTQ
jgi:hypothetical protein